jgi:hypothetical protein
MSNANVGLTLSEAKNEKLIIHSSISLYIHQTELASQTKTERVFKLIKIIFCLLKLIFRNMRKEFYFILQF